MKLGIISDTHDRENFTSAAVELLQQAGVELLIHCGDIETPETALLFAPIPTHFVFGNWDKQVSPLLDAIQQIGGSYHPGWGYLELSSKKIAWCHSHLRGELEELEELREFNFLFYGHTHRAESHRTGKTLVLNPGAMFRVDRKTFAVVDLESGDAEWIEVRI